MVYNAELKKKSWRTQRKEETKYPVFHCALNNNDSSQREDTSFFPSHLPNSEVTLPVILVFIAHSPYGWLWPSESHGIGID